MLRLTFAARITLIIVVALVALWVGAIAAFYRSHGPGPEAVGPPPARLAALANLIEQAPPAARATILAAVNDPEFVAHIETAGLASLAEPGEQPPDPSIIGAYAATLAGRDYAIVAPVRIDSTALFPRLLRGTHNMLQFRIALRPSGTLVVETTRPVLLNRLGLPVGFGAALFGTVVALIALVVMQSQTRPLARLAAAVDRVELAEDAPPLRAERRAAPEIKAVVRAFNRLQQRLGDMMRGRMAMFGGISHDVRTFATRLRMRVDRIPEEAERDRAVADIDDMVRLLDDALLTGRAATGAIGSELVDLAEIVRTEVADRRGANLRVDLKAVSAPANVLGDRLALRRIVANITDNALKYGGAAHLTLGRGAGDIVLAVEDEGTGIPPAEREAVFQPFTRLEPSRSRGTGGAGLGLAIVRSLVEAHGGSVAIESSTTGGGRVVVRLPLFRS